MDLGIDSVGYLKSSSLRSNEPSVTPTQTYPNTVGASGAIGLTPDYSSFRNTWFGQPQPVSYKLLWRAYLEEPTVRACIDITADAIIGDGYVLESESEPHLKQVMDVFKTSNFQKYIQDTVTSLLVYGDAYSEIVRGDGGKVSFFKPVDSATVRVDYNEHGETLKYVQRVLHRRVEFYPNEMVHFSLNNAGGRVYGISNLQSVIFTLNTKIAAQNFNAEYFRRPGLPRGIWISKNLSTEMNNRNKTTLQQVTPQSDIYAEIGGAGDLTFQTVAPKNTDMQFIELINFLRQDIIAATGVPPLFLGITEGSNRANSQTQMEAWDRKKKKMRLMIEDIINLQVMTAANFGFDDVKFRFNDENSREKLKYGQLAQLMSTIKWMTPNQILQVAGFPVLSDKTLRFYSSTGKIDKRENSDGDTPIYEIEQKQAEENMQNGVMIAGKPSVGGKSITNPNATNPQKSQSKVENAERNNTAQQKETKEFGRMVKGDPRRDYPYGAVETEKEVTDPDMRNSLKERLKQIAEGFLRANENYNREFDTQVPAEVSNVKKKPPVKSKKKEDKKEEPKEEVPSGKAVFFHGTDQISEMKKTKK